jgi:hypothetical protein
MDLKSDLLTNLYTPLGTTSNYSATANLYNLHSLQHPLNLFQPDVSSPAVPWQRLLTVEILQLPALRSSCHSRSYRTLCQLSILLSLPRWTQLHCQLSTDSSPSLLSYQLNYKTCYAVSANFIFPINYHSHTPRLEKSIVAKGCKFSLYALNFIGVRSRNRVPSNKSIFGFRPDQTKYSITRLSKVEKEIIIIINIIIIIIIVTFFVYFSALMCFSSSACLKFVFDFTLCLSIM